MSLGFLSLVSAAGWAVVSALTLTGALTADLRGAYLTAFRTVFGAVGCAVWVEAVVDLSATFTAADLVFGWTFFSVDMLKIHKKLNV